MRKWEFSKKLAAWAVVVATLAAALSYALAALDKQSVSLITKARSQMMNYIVENWYIVVGLLALCVALFYVRLTDVQEWLLGVVTEAEKQLGSGTGQLKLRQVYDKFLEKFPLLSVLVPFKMFAEMVDKALERMRLMLAGNSYAQSYVEGK